MDKLSASVPGHVPVLLAEAIAAAAPRSGDVVVDATFGGGGYTRALLASPAARVIAVDRDPAAAGRGRALATTEPRLAVLEGPFGDLEDLLAGIGVDRVDVIVADLGLSSLQLDDSARGFSFARPGPLDMRMGATGPSAAELVATLDESELVRIFRDYGDEPHARRIARAIVAARRGGPIETTDALRALVATARPGGRGRIDPATQVFQALRIAVNDELGELERLLEAARRLLRPGGRLVVVTFHSGEDRIVKRFVDGAGGRVVGRSRHLPPAAAAPRDFAWAARGVIRPTAEECLRNPRSRSAKLRAAIRLAATAAEGGPGEPTEDDLGAAAWRAAA